MGNSKKTILNNSILVSNKRLELIYEITMSILALVAAFIAFLDITERIPSSVLQMVNAIDTAILVIFTIDYIVRIIAAKEKMKFIKQNIFDLVAIIPFNSLFRIFRVTRLFRIVRLTKLIKLVRLFAFAKRFMARIDEFIHTNGFINALYLTISSVVFGAVGIYLTEFNKTGNSFSDAMWWSFVTTTTVGYGDISPKTISGRIIASVLMIVGIGFVGMLTGTIATYFLNSKKEVRHQVTGEKVLDLTGFNENEINEILCFVEFIKSKKK